MFQIPEFEQSEQEDSSPADRSLGPSPTGDGPPGPSKHRYIAPGLLGEAGHQQGQRASNSHHGGYPCQLPGASDTQEADSPPRQRAVNRGSTATRKPSNEME
ncbi:Bcl2-Associated Agonist Of Cell Death [Manis pentadactyla]|nr:Bcl2-Associated Agonist Of Cell Death [Manis pentadactyla]